jgi:hypothetical protein
MTVKSREASHSGPRHKPHTTTHTVLKGENDGQDPQCPQLPRPHQPRQPRFDAAQGRGNHPVTPPAQAGRGGRIAALLAGTVVLLIFGGPKAALIGGVILAILLFLP